MILAVYGTYVALQSIMVERSCLLPNIHLMIVIAEENAQQPHPFLYRFLFGKMYARRDMINAYLQILLLDFSPQ